MTAAIRTQERANRHLVLEKTSNLADFGLWPMLTELDPEKWLANFLPNELPYALHLLNAFVYLSEPITIQLFTAAFHNLSTAHHGGRTFISARNSWRHFLNTAVITYVTGERPNPTDSGHLFARHARQRLHIDEDQIIEPAEAVAKLANSPSFPLVIVDDLSASGEQFLKWWTRRYPTLETPQNSMQLAAHGRTNIFFCPAVCTAYAKRRIAQECPNVTVSAGNVVPDEYSVFNEHSNVWPDHLKAGAMEFLATASKRAGVPDTDGGDSDWRGFHKLGLCIAFSHSTPDATIPLFSWQSPTWTPLARRS